MTDAPFAAKLNLVLNALSMSRGRCAAQLGVDKSLVGRWCAGTVTPSAHNLERLTHLIAGLRPGFTMVDWDNSVGDLAEKLGVGAPAAALTSIDGFGTWLSAPGLKDAVAGSVPAAAACEGFWQTIRPAAAMPGNFVRENVMLQATGNGVLSFRMGLYNIRLQGWAYSVGNQMFCAAVNIASGTQVFSIFNRPMADRADLMDGITLSCMADTGGAPVAAACLLHRTGVLSGDADADDRQFEAMLSRHPVIDKGVLPLSVQRHLLRDVGPAAMASGGDAVLIVPFIKSLAVGAAWEAPAPFAGLSLPG